MWNLNVIFIKTIDYKRVFFSSGGSFFIEICYKQTRRCKPKPASLSKAFYAYSNSSISKPLLTKVPLHYNTLNNYLSFFKKIRKNIFINKVWPYGTATVKLIIFTCYWDSILGHVVLVSYFSVFLRLHFILRICF